MPSLLNTTYPPEVESFAPAFISTEALKVYFSYSKYNSGNLDKLNIHYVVVDSQTNESAFNNTSTEPSGLESNIDIILARNYSGGGDISNYKQIQYDEDKQGYYFIIDPPGIDKTIAEWKVNQYYKLQLRFDGNENMLSDIDAAGGRLKYMNSFENQQTYFSEWSKVCLLRPIWKPNISLTRFPNSEDENPKWPSFNRGMIPLRGRMEFQRPGSSSGTLDPSNEERESETLQYYQVVVVDPNTEEEIFRSENIYTGDSADFNEIYYNIDAQGFEVEDVTQYILRIEYLTRNNYRGSQEWYFNVVDYVTMPDFNPRITVCIDNEEGVADIHITNDKTVFGVLYVKRSDSRSQFKLWEDFKICVVGLDDSDSPGKIDMHLYDDTASSLLWYQYSVQLENQYGGLSQLHVSDDVIMPEFYDTFLKRLDKKAPIRYNYKISSFKPVVNRVKFDTLGGKYPKFAENASMNYKQFQIQGLISAQADPNMTFLNKKEWFKQGIKGQYDDYLNYKTYEPTVWYDNKSDIDTLLTKRKVRDRIDSMYGVSDASDDCAWPGWLEQEPMSTDDNYDWMWERIYREELMQWLNDGEPKLYRSMTEGNMCVMITDVSLTPNATLGRRIWDFSATLYEVEDGYSLDKLYQLGIIDKYTPLSWCLIGNRHDELTKTTSCVLDDGRVIDISLYDPHYSVVKPGQVYVYKDKDDSSNDIIATKIQPDLNFRYSGRWNNLIATNSVISDVKIFFHNEPHVYLQPDGGDIDHLILVSTSNQNITTENSPWYDNTDAYRTNANILTSAEDPKNRYILGYRIGVQWSGTGKFEEIFVPYREDGMIPLRHSYYRYDATNPTLYPYAEKPIKGYYFIPGGMSISKLWFPDDVQDTDEPQDEVTVEYVVRYEEHADSNSMTIKDIAQARRIVGQHSRVFYPEDTLADDIAEKYAFIKEVSEGQTTSQEVQFWYGVCVETEPYALISLKYYQDDTWSDPLLVGLTGVLHLLKDEKLADLRFLGKQMYERTGVVENLREWEYVESRMVVNDKSEIESPRWNYVYTIGGKRYIYYHTNFYPFDYYMANGTVVEGIGIVRAPVYGRVEYLADVLEVTRAIGQHYSGEAG